MPLSLREKLWAQRSMLYSHEQSHIRHKECVFIDFLFKYKCMG